MPTSRFFGYLSYMQKVLSRNQSPEEAKRELLDEIDWDEEVKRLKHGNIRKN